MPGDEGRVAIAGGCGIPWGGRGAIPGGTFCPWAGAACMGGIGGRAGAAGCIGAEGAPGCAGGRIPGGVAACGCGAGTAGMPGDDAY